MRAFGHFCGHLQSDTHPRWSWGRTGTLCQKSVDRAPIVVVPALLSVNLFLMMLFHTGGRWYLPPSLFSEGFRARMYMASFTPLSNHFDSTDSILMLSNVMAFISGHDNLH